MDGSDVVGVSAAVGTVAASVTGLFVYLLTRKSVRQQSDQLTTARQQLADQQTQTTYFQLQNSLLQEQLDDQKIKTEVRAAFADLMIEVTSLTDQARKATLEAQSEASDAKNIISEARHEAQQTLDDIRTAAEAIREQLISARVDANAVSNLRAGLEDFDRRVDEVLTHPKINFSRTETVESFDIQVLLTASHGARTILIDTRVGSPRRFSIAAARRVIDGSGGLESLPGAVEVWIVAVDEVILKAIPIIDNMEDPGFTFKAITFEQFKAEIALLVADPQDI